MVVAVGCSSGPDTAANRVSTSGVTQPVQITPLLGSATTSPLNRGLLGDLDPAPPSPPNIDGEPAAVLPLPSPTTPSGDAPNDIAARVALTAFNDPDWATTVAADLDPGYAAFIAAARRGSTDPAPHRPVTLVAVETDINDPHTVFVAFDEITDIEAIRHVTAIQFADIDASRPIVIDVVPLA